MAQMAVTMAEQKEQLAVQTALLEKVTDQVADKEMLLEDMNLTMDQIAGQAYDLAAADIIEKTVTETQKADRILIRKQ